MTRDHPKKQPKARHPTPNIVMKMRLIILNNIMLNQMSSRVPSIINLAGLVQRFIQHTRYN